MKRRGTIPAFAEPGSRRVLEIEHETVLLRAPHDVIQPLVRIVRDERVSERARRRELRGRAKPRGAIPGVDARKQTIHVARNRRRRRLKPRGTVVITIQRPAAPFRERRDRREVVGRLPAHREDVHRDGRQRRAIAGVGVKTSRGKTRRIRRRRRRVRVRAVHSPERGGTSRGGTLRVVDGTVAEVRRAAEEREDATGGVKASSRIRTPSRVVGFGARTRRAQPRQHSLQRGSERARGGVV